MTSVFPVKFGMPWVDRGLRLCGMFFASAPNIKDLLRDWNLTLKATTLPFVIWLPDTPMRPGSSWPPQLTDWYWLYMAHTSHDQWRGRSLIVAGCGEYVLKQWWRHASQNPSSFKTPGPTDAGQTTEIEIVEDYNSPPSEAFGRSSKDLWYPSIVRKYLFIL